MSLSCDGAESIPKATLDTRGPGLRVVLAAHPDDETIGLGIHLSEWGDQTLVVHLTDGSPRQLADARSAGFTCAQDYALARRMEALAALRLAGIKPRRICRFGYTDQELTHNLSRVVSRLVTLFETLEPASVLVHPYEGGHPDHDAASFAAASAVKLASTKPVLLEFTSYFARNRRMVTSQFIPRPGIAVWDRTLTLEERQLKQKMLDAFGTQKGSLSNFAAEQEHIRIAPEYDYTLPANDGELLYELNGFDLTGAHWLKLARQAAEELGI